MRRTWHQKVMDAFGAAGLSKRLIRTVFLILVSALAHGVLAQSPVPGRMIVKFREGTHAVRAQLVLASANARVVDEIPQLGLKLVQYPPSMNPMQMARSFRMTDGVAFAEPDWLVSPAQVVPNDPLFANQSSYMNRVSAPDAWSLTPGSSSVIVAVLDTGVFAGHSDLAANLVPGRNVYSDTNDTNDLFGHGTSVCGTIGAVGNNGNGIAAMAWGCRIMPIRICSDSSSSSSTYYMAKGLTWAADNGARVANISYTGAGSSSIASGAAYFVSKGGVMSMAAGNQSTNLTFAMPADYVVVGATASNDTLASYSNYGTPIALVAPGTVYTTNRSGGYGNASGTSFASPMAAGVLALMKSANPSLSPARIYELFKNNCDDLGAPGWDPTFGNGRINAFLAVEAAMNDGGDVDPPSVDFSAPSNGATVSGTLNVLVSASDSGSGMQNVTLSVDGSNVGTLSAAPYQWSWNTSSLANGNHTLLATARDVAGNTATRTITVNVQNADTTPPTVTFTNPLNGQSVSGTATVQVNASDSGSGMQSVSLSIDGTNLGTDTSAPYSWTWNTTTWSNGSHTLVATARDTAGNTATRTITVNVQNGDTTPPVVAITDPTGGYLGNTLTVLVDASDNVGVTRVDLYFNGVLSGSSSASPFMTALDVRRAKRGKHRIQVRAFDAAGNSAWSQTVHLRK